MFALYRQQEDTLVFRGGGWTTREDAEHATETDRRPGYVVRPVQLLVDDVEVVGGRVLRVGGELMFDLSARVLATGARRCMGWYATERVAMKKRRKFADDARYDDWVIELNSVEQALWAENVATETSSGEEK